MTSKWRKRCGRDYLEVFGQSQALGSQALPRPPHPLLSHHRVLLISSWTRTRLRQHPALGLLLLDQPRAQRRGSSLPGPVGCCGASFLPVTVLANPFGNRARVRVTSVDEGLVVTVLLRFQTGGWGRRSKTTNDSKRQANDGLRAAGHGCAPLRPRAYVPPVSSRKKEADFPPLVAASPAYPLRCAEPYHPAPTSLSSPARHPPWDELAPRDVFRRASLCGGPPGHLQTRHSGRKARALSLCASSRLPSAHKHRPLGVANTRHTDLLAPRTIPDWPQVTKLTFHHQSTLFTPLWPPQGAPPRHRVHAVRGRGPVHQCRQARLEEARGEENRGGSAVSWSRLAIRSRKMTVFAGRATFGSLGRAVSV